ncbi:MAG: hypothetical protein IKR94_08780 [Bacteroidales bacterium]|nr:hypothetical protein [Bacteroidales bacterium]MBR4215398.1 hypothetical protein [Bacteroidales bacterium]
MNKYLKIRLLSIGLAAMVLAGCNSSGNQNTGENGENTANTNSDSIQIRQSEQLTEQHLEQNQDPNQDPVPIEDVKERYFAPAELKYCQQSDEYLFDKFYPIGWSKDGHFAYILEPADEAAGLYFFKFRIQNMISDKIVYEWELDPDEEVETGNVKQMWKDYETVFVEKLNKYGIIQQKNFTIEGTEFTKNDKKFKVVIENEMATNEDFGFEVVKSTQINLKSPDLGEKQIYNYTEKEFNLCVGKIIQGVLISPYENRVAVMVKTENCGYEGPPNVISQFLVGTNLTESFKK